MRVGTWASCYTELGASPGASPLCGVIWGMSPASPRLHISVHSPPTAAGRMKCERSIPSSNTIKHLLPGRQARGAVCAPALLELTTQREDRRETTTQTTVHSWDRCKEQFRCHEGT